MPPRPHLVRSQNGGAERVGSSYMSCRGILLVLAVLAVTAVTAMAQRSYTVYVGTYTTGRNVTSKGIYAYRFQPAAGEFTELGLAAETASPSFLGVHPNHRWLYAANEVQDGTISAYAIDGATRKLTLLNRLASRGEDPAYVGVDRSGKVAMAANYTSGSIIAYPIKPDGSLGEATSFFQYQGVGVKNPGRQDGPHPHETMPSPDNRFVLAPDLGLDKVLIYRLDAEKAALAPSNPAEVKISPPGVGPRHLVFHPNGRFVYLLNELGSTLNVFAYDSGSGGLRQIQAISTLPADFKGRSDAGELEVHPNGKFLYASNRGHDSLAVFAIDARTGMLSAVEHVPTQGRLPRNFAIDPTGTYLLMANQAANNIVVFRIDQQTGKLSDTGKKLRMSSPVCIVFVPEG